jgi:hypothetical protein
VRTSSFVHGLTTRRAVFAFTVLAAFVTFTVFLNAIIQVLHLNAAQLGMRCGDKKAGPLTYSILSDNWYVIVLPPVEGVAPSAGDGCCFPSPLGAQASLAIGSRLLAKRGDWYCTNTRKSSEHSA